VVGLDVCTVVLCVCVDAVVGLWTPVVSLSVSNEQTRAVSIHFTSTLR